MSLRGLRETEDPLHKEKQKTQHISNKKKSRSKRSGRQIIRIIVIVIMILATLGSVSLIYMFNKPTAGSIGVIISGTVLLIILLPPVNDTDIAT